MNNLQFSGYMIDRISKYFKNTLTLRSRFNYTIRTGSHNERQNVERNMRRIENLNRIHRPVLSKLKFHSMSNHLTFWSSLQTSLISFDCDLLKLNTFPQ